MTVWVVYLCCEYSDTEIMEVCLDKSDALSFARMFVAEDEWDWAGPDPDSENCLAWRCQVDVDVSATLHIESHQAH